MSSDPFARQLQDALSAAADQLEPPAELAAEIRARLDLGRPDPIGARPRLAALLVPLAGVAIALGVGLMLLVPSRHHARVAAPAVHPRPAPPLTTSRPGQGRRHPHPARRRPAQGPRRPAAAARQRSASRPRAAASPSAAARRSSPPPSPTARQRTHATSVPAPAGAARAWPTGTYFIPNGPGHGPIISLNAIDHDGRFVVAAGAGVACISGGQAPAGVAAGIPVVMFIRARIPIDRGNRFSYSGPATADSLDRTRQIGTLPVRVTLNAGLVRTRYGYVLKGTFSSAICGPPTTRFSGS